jgi:hypothetical protein
MSKIQAKYRTWHKGLPPKAIKLKLPGWAGDSTEHGDGSKPQPWHCLPFVEGSTYGLELIYPFDAECQVRSDNNRIVFEGKFNDELRGVSNSAGPLFGKFANNHYGFTSSLDIKPPPDHVIRIEPHPSYFTDPTWSTPLAVIGHIQSEWWPKVFFIVFRAPPPGHVHIFSKDKPIAQLLIVPKKVTYELAEMTDEEKREREILGTRYDSLASYISQHEWQDHAGNLFDDKYKVLSRAYAKNGMEGIEAVLQAAEQLSKEKPNLRKTRVRRRLIVKSPD